MSPGSFFAFGPALSQQGVVIFQAGKVRTTHPKAGERHKLTPPKASDVVRHIAAQLEDLPRQAEAEIRSLEDARAEISRLKRELTARPVQHDERAVEQRLRLVGRQHEQEITRVEREAERRYKQMVMIYEKALEELRGKLHKINSLSSIDASAAQVQVPPPAAIASVPEPPPAPRPASPRPAQPARSSSSDGSLSQGERKVMIGVAQYPGGTTRQQISILTGYKRSSRDTYIQRLRMAGYVECTNDKVTATEAGIDALGDGYEPLPTGEALREHWLKELPEGERKVLEVVIGHYPEWVAREAIDERTGYRRSSRDTYIQRLRSRLLVEVTGRGFVKASNDLFDFD
jgi:hypothetical protein